jgi:hypothetical protein
MKIFFETYQPIIQGITVIVLSCATIYYAYITKKTFLEIKKQKDYSILPVISIKKFEIHNNHKANDSCVECTLENIGNGPAVRINITFYDEEGHQILESQHDIDYIKPGEITIPHIHIPKKEFDAIKCNKDNIALILANIHCHDFAGNHYTMSQEYSFHRKEMTMSPLVGTFDFQF